MTQPTLHRTALIALVFAAGSMLPCAIGPPEPSLYLQWKLVVPDRYEGFLLIRYDCPGGSTIPIEADTAQITFPPDGIYCTSDSFRASWSDGDSAESHSGTTIPFYSGPFDHSGASYTGYGLYGGDTLGIGGGTLSNPGVDMTFTVYWAGPMERAFQAHEASGAAYPDDVDAFLVERSLLSAHPDE